MNARNAYMSQMVSTASPARLLVMLLERLARDVEQAAEAQEAGEHLAARPHLLIHAQEIVLELLHLAAPRPLGRRRAARGHLRLAAHRS